MTGKELLEKLKGLSEDELKYPVYVYADHGQTQQPANYFTLNTATELGYDLEDTFVHEDDREDYDESELQWFIEIA